MKTNNGLFHWVLCATKSTANAAAGGITWKKKRIGRKLGYEVTVYSSLRDDADSNQDARSVDEDQEVSDADEDGEQSSVD